MKIQRQDIEARNCLNFSQVKKAPSLQEERFKPFVDGYEGHTVGKALENAEKVYSNANWHARDERGVRTGWGVAATVGTGAAIWAAVADNLLLAGGIGAAVTGAIGIATYYHFQGKKWDAQATVAGDAHKTMEKAADELAASLVCDGPGPDQFTDKRYYTGGVIQGVATVHSRESGAVLRTQVDLGGAVPRRLESNVAKNTVSVRSPKGDQTFNAELELRDQGFVIKNHGTQNDTNGPISQSISPDGSSRINGKRDSYNTLSLSTSEASGKDKGFQASSYVWENGQVAEYDGDTLFVATPIVPFQDLTKVRILPDGVVGRSSRNDGTHLADELAVPASLGAGTWTSVSNPQLTPRLIETPFPGGFTALSDQKAGTVKLTAGDGATLDTKSTLVETNKAFRLHTQHTLGPLEQSLLPGEVLLNLQEGDRTISVQHKSGLEPTASEHKDEDFISSGNGLTVSLENGTYWVGDGASKIDLKPLMPLDFLERKGAPVAKPAT